MKKILPVLLTACLIPFLTQAQKQLSTAYFETLVKKNATLIGLDQADLKQIRISDAYYDNRSKSYMVYLQQTYKSVDIYNAITALAFKNETLSAGKFTKRIRIEESGKDLSADPVIKPGDGIRKAAAAIGLTYNNSFSLPLKQTPDGRHLGFQKFEGLFNDIAADLTWVAVDNDEKKFKLSWNILLHTEKDNAVWVISVDALSGNIIAKKNLTVYEKANQNFRPHHIYVYEDNQPEKNNVVNNPDEPESISSGNYRVIPYPAVSPVVKAGVPTTVANPWTAFPNANATTLKWNSNGTVDFANSTGNNVLVSEDLRDRNNQSGTRALSSTAVPNLNFLRSPDYSNPTLAEDNQQFALTNLFYWNNILHDMLYQYGFDEVSGNFQSNNLSRGGGQFDNLYADGQDGYSMDNANFGTPPDAQHPRMQMFLWSRPPTLLTLKGNSPSGYLGPVPAKTGVLSNRAEKAPITSDVVLYKNNTTGYNACVAPSNASELNGKIAYLQRGTCNFTIKVKNAQNAGAIGVIVGDSIPVAQSFLVTMINNTRVDGSYVFDTTIKIPNVFITTGEANRLRNLLTGGQKVNVTLTSANLDGSLDNSIISHEYGHGVSNRLTGGPSNVSCFLDYDEQGGEGISDYIALMMTTDWNKALLTDGTKPRAIANYVIGADSAGPGIRAFPYSASLSVNPWTYDSLLTIPVEAHLIGEVWCAMLWEMTWSVIGQAGSINKNFADADGTGGNSIAMNLFMQGLKLQPCKPSFMDARNAILSADTLLYGGAYSPAIWKAFAKRGLGYSAKQGKPDSLQDNISAYDLPAVLPVTFESFTAEKRGSAALLEWTTAMENNTDKFIVERSDDGKPFLSIGEVKAAGNSTVKKHYQHTDAFPAKGNNLYRIKEVDKDGKTNLSELRSLNFTDLRPEIKISPNPATSIVTINIPGNNQNLTVRLLSNTGQLISKHVLNGETLSVNVSSFAAGVYNITIDGKGYAAKYKLVIQ